MTVAKSLAAGFPLSGVVGKAQVMDAPDPGGLGGTYGGNPVACAAGLAVMDVMRDEHLPERAARIGSVVEERMQSWAADHKLIGDVRVVGAMAGEEIVNPATGKVIAHVPKGTDKDVDRAVEAARKAFDGGWSDSTPRDRSERMLKLADAIAANGDEFARIESENVGKPLAATKSEEIPPIVDCIRFFAGAARVLEGRATGEYMRGFTSMLRREPLGVVGSIAPWNYPLMMAAWKIGPALAAGNTVVLKPSEWTPLSALKLAELAADIFPPGVFNGITGDGEPVGAGIVRHPGVSMVSLTGGVATGKEVARAAASTLKRVHLELGGKAPVVVFDDADLDKVVEWIKIGGYFNAGQDCTAATRVIAGPHIHEKLLGDLR